MFVIVLPIIIAVFVFLVYSHWEARVTVAKNNIKTSAIQEMPKQRLNIYEKIKQQEPIHYLMIGDSIGQGAGAPSGKQWYAQLNQLLKDEYGVLAFGHNLNQGGSTIIHGWARYGTSRFLEKEKIDLVFICLGQNDRAVMSPEEFGGMYESLVRGLKRDMPNAEIIPIIESSITNNETFPEQINKISQYYNLTPVDTRVPFNNSGIPYRELAPDGVHPNEKGYALYAKQILDLLTENMNKGRVIEVVDKESLTKFSAKDTIHVIEKFTKMDGFEPERPGSVYLAAKSKGNVLETEFEGDFLGLDMMLDADGGLMDVYIDGQRIKTVSGYNPTIRFMKIFVTSGLQYGKHTVKIESLGEKAKTPTGEDSKGTMVRIKGIVTN